MNKFEEILDNYVSDESDKTVLAEIAEKYPDLKNGWLRQEDYSRNMDLNRKFIDHAKAWDSWKANNWDDEAKMTKAQKQAMDRLALIEEENYRYKQLAETGDNMTFEELTKTLDTEMQKRGVVTKAELDQKEKFVDDSFKGHAYVSAMMPTLAVKYYAETGKILDGVDFLSKVNQFGETDLAKVYERYVAPELEAKKKAELEAEREQLAKDKEDFEKRKNQFVPGVAVPTDQGLDQGMSPFEAKVRGVQNSDSTATSAMELGRGAIAAYAAQKFREQQLNTQG